MDIVMLICRRTAHFVSLFVLALAFCCGEARAQEVTNDAAVQVAAEEQTTSVAVDTLAPISTAETAADTSTTKKSFVKRVIHYFLGGGKGDKKRFQVAFLPGPHYSSTAGLGLGAVATCLFSCDPSDTTLQRSNVSLYGDITTKLRIKVGIKGNTIFRHDRMRLDYEISGSSFPTKFWGIGFDNGNDDLNETSYKRLELKAMARMLFRIAPNTFIGPVVDYEFVEGKNTETPKRYASAEPDDAEAANAGRALFEGQRLTQNSRMVGVSFTYDSRDFILNAYKGWFLRIDQLFAPKALGNKSAFSSTDLTVSTYHRLWRTAILAAEWHSRFTYGNVPWGMLSEAGTTCRLRGYYEGRYRDRDIGELQVELRQQIARRFGVTVWGGAGEVFSKPSELRFSRILPNAGIGFRWAFRPRVNIRIDYGFTRNGGGFIFQINEAF